VKVVNYKALHYAVFFSELLLSWQPINLGTLLSQVS